MPVSLIHNLVLLIALTSFYGFFLQQLYRRPKTFKVVVGIWFGLAAIAGMMLPFEFQKGIFYDGRSIILGLIALFGGWLPALLSAVLAAAYRIYLGGPGVYAGVSTVILCALTGLALRHYYRSQVLQLKLSRLFLIGLLVSLAMLVSQLLNPWTQALQALHHIWLPVLLLFPTAFMLIAALLIREEQRLVNEKQLRASELRIRTTLYSIGDGVITTDHHGRITLMNTIAEQLTGWSEQEALGRPIEEVFVIVYEDTRKQVESPVRRVLEEGVIVGLANHTLLLARDGRELPIADSGAPIADEQGNTSGVVLVFRDQSEAHRYEKELREKEYFLRESQKAGKVGSYMFDIKNNLWTASPALNQIFGVDENFTRNAESWLRLVHPDQQEEMHTHLMQEVIEKGQPFNKEYRIIRQSDETIRWVHGHGELVLDPAGHPLKMIGTIQDVTEAVEARERLKKSEEKFRKLFEKHSAIHMLLNPDTGQIISANKAAASFYGWSMEELENMNIQEINTMAPDEISEVMQGVKKGSSRHFEVQHRLANGQVRDVEIFTSRVDVFDDAYLYAIIHDITDKKRLLKDLVKAKEKAEESDLLKSAFMANMSHEIRTPLNGILGFTSLLTAEELPPPDKRRDYAAIINRSADSLMQLINDILDISKMDAGQLTIEQREFNLLHTLNSLEIMYQKRLVDTQKNQIKLQGQFPHNNMLMKGDENRLTQIFTNLLDNAIKFTNQGEIAFGIRKITEASITFFVSDTGKGIAPNRQAQIFDRFAQEDESISQHYGGTGLGLAIVKRLMELMQGEITLHSEQGQGTCFEFTIPAQISRAPSPGKGTKATKEEDRAPGHLTILLVEDDPVNQLFYREVLNEPNFNLFLANNGREALKMNEKHRPDVILLDIRLPDLNGLEVARQIRASGNQVWIIGQSAYAMAGDEQAALDAGCNEYLTKPVKASLLLQRLNTLAGM